MKSIPCQRPSSRQQKRGAYKATPNDLVLSKCESSQYVYGRPVVCQPIDGAGFMLPARGPSCSECGWELDGPKCRHCGME